MAVQPQTPYQEDIANGVTTVFPLEFDCENKDHLIVLIDDVEADSLTWALANKEVTFTIPPELNKKITFQRNTPFKRDRNYQSYDNSLRPDPLNKDFDWIWLKAQELGVSDWLLGLKIQKFRDDVNLTALEETLEQAKEIRDDTADSVIEVQNNVAQSQTLLADTAAEANQAQSSATAASTANTAAQQALVQANAAEGNVYAALSAQTATVNTALVGFTNGASKWYATLALAEADIANIGIKDKVDIGEVANGGTWYKATAGATSLTKSPYDPLAQAKVDATTKANLAELEAKNAAINLSQSSYEITQLLAEKSTLNTDVIKFGYLGTTTSGTSAPAATYVLINPAATETLINKFSIVSNIASGDIELRTYSRVGDVFTMLKKVATLKINKIGTNTFTQSDFIPFEVEQGQYVAVTVLTSGAMTYDAAGTEDIYYPLHIAETPFTASMAGKSKIKVAFYASDDALRAKDFIDSVQKNSSDSIGAISQLFQDSTTTKGLSAIPSEKSGVNAGAGHYCMGFPLSSFGSITGVKVFSPVAGDAQVGVYTRNGNVFTRKTFIDVILVVGLNDIPVNLPASKGDYVGLRTTLAGQVGYELLTTGHEGMFVSQVGSTSNSFTSSTTNPLTQYAYQLRFSVTLKTAIQGNSQKWLGKKYVSFGDSVTWYNGKAFFPSHNEAGIVAKGYQSYIVDALGCTLDNKGESGWTMPSIYASRVNTYDFTDAYAVTITSGANDHKNSVAVGAVQPIGSAFNTNTYAGALQASIEKVINSNKDTKIFLITPIRGWYSQAIADAITGEMQGVRALSDRYANVMKEIGILYGLQVVDFYNEAGFNDLNKTTFLGDNAETISTHYLLHPNNKGYQRMGELLLATLKDF